MKVMKKFWFDKETGEFNWAIVAILALAAIFFYNVLTANVNVPDGSALENQETVQDIHLDNKL